ncbi:MAG: 23S rRNA (pseudouridine(1915)-N(3))-methyltransferase RlmH [Gammaproteobacteria bacterium]|jgi:23S rRNA (pseudouridine1915-N3)-methyltransferase
MRIRLLAAGTRMPGWVDAGYQAYATRLPHECRLELKEIPLGRRGRGADVKKAVASEGERMLAAAGPTDRVIALEVTGRALDTPQLSRHLDGWMQDGRDVSMLVGGPDGLAHGCLEQADFRWSLSPLTLPHGLVRIVVAEQLYRAWSLLRGHPYHRE